jgi:AraC family transcriptional regulator, ethanolamine operon transcriptional activator
MSGDSSPKLLLSQRFTSFEELAALVIAWDFDFHQLSKNYSDTALEQVQAGNILFSHLSCGCFSTHAGETPKGMCTVGLPDAGCSEFRYFDHRVDRPVLLVRSPGQEFDVVARPGYGISTFSIPQPVFEAYCETNLDGSTGRLPDREKQTIPITPEVAMNFRVMALELRSFAQFLPDSSAQSAPVQSFESRVLENLVRAFEQDGCTTKVPGATARSQIFRRAREVIRDHPHERLNVPDLVAALNTTERTLERVFDREIGISPKKFLFGQRMYGAHRQLWHSTSSETSVADIANAWGFWHMGQFAKDYRRLFGELPSETLNRFGTTRPPEHDFLPGLQALRYGRSGPLHS